MSARLLLLGGKDVCPDLIMASGKCTVVDPWNSWVRGCTGIGWVLGGRATETWPTEDPLLAGFRPPRRLECLLFLNLREWSIIQELYM